jgi:hypothetical protein
MTEQKTLSQGDVTGVVVLPILIAIGYAAYLFYTDGHGNTNAGLLLIGGVLALLASGPATFFQPQPPNMKWLASVTGAICYVFFFYMAFIIGWLALGLSLAEWPGWGMVLVALLWIILGSGGFFGLRRARAERARRAKFVNWS